MIQAAREAFAATGFHGTGMAQIAQTSGIAVGQIYRDFANKEAIVAEIVARDLEDFLSERGLCAAGATGDPAVVRAWIGQFVACENPRGDDSWRRSWPRHRATSGLPKSSARCGSGCAAS
ncbi:TetR/AcrR family transcriptional regulator [Sphingomonas sp. ABOLG]|uniref:TetR/AcrR family transcriptional regulator n=1 Tax=Sphingomonas sp. ABOLG TaxID=1985880 RepID=UPI0013DD9C34|nr:TetR/AcrR family transcriptional regulator [Sphingomonas sp. ABOLG]